MALTQGWMRAVVSRVAYLLVVAAFRNVIALVSCRRRCCSGPLHRVRAGVGTLRARLDLGAIAGLLQWYAVLAAWGLAPLVLWR